MRLFGSVKNYSEMVDKISISTFAISAIILFLMSQANKDFQDSLANISFGASIDVFNLKLNLALFYIPFLIGMLEHIFKIHDLLSDLLKIRANYDRRIIVENIIKKSENALNTKNLSRKEVEELMQKCFYKYVSSTNPQIDSHYIIITLTEWCWFWIILDTMVMLLIVTIVFLIQSFSLCNLLLCFFGELFFGCLLFFIYRMLIKYTKDEINQLFSDSKRASEIKEVLKDALCNK